MFKYFLSVYILLILVSCTTIREVTKVETRIVHDTVKVLVPGWADSTHGFWEDTSVVTGVFIDSVKHDTILVVKYRKADTVFTAKFYPDTVEKVITRVDTMRIVTQTQEPTFFENYWWIFLIAATITVIIIAVLKR